MEQRFEVTVAGRLGPVFRAALRPCWVSESERSTVLLTGPQAPADLAELVALLTSQGIHVQSVVAREPPESG